MPTNPAAGLTKLALLIDGDNVSAAFMPIIWREAEKHGAIAVRRLYAQFKSGKMKSWLKPMADFDLMAVNVSPLTHGKNATDMRLVIEAMDMLYGRQLDGFCIASSDGDFSPLAARVRGNAMAVYGFGAKKAPQGYKDEFDRFYECDTILAAEKKTAPKRPSTAAPKAASPAAPARAPARRPAAPKASAPPPVSRPPAAKAVQQPRAVPGLPGSATGAGRVPIQSLLAAVDSVKGADGWSHLRDLGNALERTGFSPRKNEYKVANLVKLHPDLIEVTKRGNETYVRRLA